MIGIVDAGVSINQAYDKKKLNKPATIQLSKLVRVVRMIRFTRLAKLYKYIHDYVNPSQDIIDEDGVDQSVIGAKIADLLTRR